MNTIFGVSIKPPYREYIHSDVFSFDGCKYYTYICIENMKTKCKYLSGMFRNCIRLKYLDLTNFITEINPRDYDCFTHCDSLLYLNLESLHNTDKWSLIDSAFNLKNLKYLNMINFKVPHIVDMYAPKNNMKAIHINYNMSKIIHMEDDMYIPILSIHIV